MDLRGHVTNESWCRLKVTEKCAFATSTRVGGWRTPRGAAKILFFFGCHEMLDLKAVIARFGAEAKAKLANPGATGEPEDQLRAPLEWLFADFGELCGFRREWLVAVGESSLSALKTRPDYAEVCCGPCQGLCPPLPTAARRSYRTIGRKKPRAHGSRRRLAKAPLSRSERSAIRRRLCAGRHLRPAHGPLK